MKIKAVFVFCASVFFIQTISGQAIGNTIQTGMMEVNNIVSSNGIGFASGGSGFGSGVSVTGYGAGLGVIGYGPNLNGVAGLNGIAFNGVNNGFVASGNGGAFTVTSSSPIAPNGLSVMSDNVIEGPIAVIGTLPFLSAVGLEGQVPDSGTAGVQYSCGNGNVGIVSEGLNAAAGVTSAGMGAAGLAGGFGLANARTGFNTGLAAECGCNTIY